MKSNCIIQKAVLLIEVTDAMKSKDILVIKTYFHTYKQREAEKEIFQGKRFELHERYSIYKDLYFWYKRKRGQHEQLLDLVKSFGYYGRNCT